MAGGGRRKSLGEREEGGRDKKRGRMNNRTSRGSEGIIMARINRLSLFTCSV